MAKLKPARSKAKGGTRPAAAVAEAPRIYNLFPLLVGPIPAWIAELPRIAAMGFNWVYVNPFFQSGQSGSLYAIRDPARIDARFRAPAGSDLEQISSFTAAAEALGLKVMADLVVNHTAKDALLAERRWDIYQHDASGDLLSPGAADATAPGGWRIWEDLAELNYQRSDYRDFLVRHFDEHVAFLQSAGVLGFRCDAAYKVPGEVWEALIRSAKAREAGCLFAAETLGCTPDEAKAVASAGFDYLFNSFAWWDSRAGWALEQHEDFRLAAPSIAFPENHDMARLAASLDGDPDTIADALAGRYALAAAFSAGVLLPIGYEWGSRRQLHVAFTKPTDREHNTGVDISDRIAAINRLKAETACLNLEGALIRLSAPDAPHLALLRLDSGHRAGASEAVLVLANPGAEPATIATDSLLAGIGGGFAPFAEMGGAETSGLTGDGVVELGPYQVRFYRAAALVRPASKTRPSKPSGEGRVVIETVWPEIDGGRAAAKRVVGERLEVWADIFSDGHDKIAAELLVRHEDEAEWRRVPMRFVDNDRWSGSFVPETIGRHRYTIEAWRDRWASYVSEIGKKRAAGQMLASEAIEGVALVEGFASHVKGAGHEALHAFVETLKTLAWPAQIDALLDPEAVATVAPYAEREQVSRYPVELPLIVDRLAARFSSWYELFPRSASGDPKRHGTFDDVIARLPYVKDLGFDVLYFPPIHPIGTTNRKGKNNSLTPGPDDVGSTYATGSADGGHDAIHPLLGSFEDFKRLLDAAHKHGLEIALDFAIQCSPDHPWIKEHPEWFDWRPDGTIKFAENPPKKYEDIVNVDFYRPGALPGLWHALYDVVMFWVGHGVKIFRVDNPHTKPIPFWDWLIGE
ncbi:MAG: DUF3416 domain-containing protein, partial [Bauldia sp.]|nr:DUF3416 domain-containing protein [Bauldia sp.]